MAWGPLNPSSGTNLLLPLKKLFSVHGLRTWPVRMYVHCMNAGCPGKPERVSESPELELQTIVSPHVGAGKIEPQSSSRAASALTTEPSPSPSSSTSVALVSVFFRTHCCLNGFSLHLFP